MKFSTESALNGGSLGHWWIRAEYSRVKNVALLLKRSEVSELLNLCQAMYWNRRSVSTRG
jgi:hypothetical protein